MVVHNAPDTIDAAQARSPTHPQLGRVTASQCALDMVKAMNEGEIAVRRDAQIAYLVSDGAIVCSEGSFPGLTFTFRPNV